MWAQTYKNGHREVRWSPEAWLDRVLARIRMEDEVKRIAEERTRTEERLRRLGRAYVDNLYSDNDYRRQKRDLEDRLAGLVAPEADAARAAGEMLQSRTPPQTRACAGGVNTCGAVGNLRA